MNEREQQRKIKQRLATLRHAAEVTGNVAQTCRYFGISRPTFYKWLCQYEEFGEEGLRDRSSRPKHCPHETTTEVVGKIMNLLRPAAGISTWRWLSPRCPLAVVYGLRRPLCSRGRYASGLSGGRQRR